MGDEATVDLPGLGDGAGWERFRDKARVFLRAHVDHDAVRKLRGNQRLTSGDLRALEDMFLAGGLDGHAYLERAREDGPGLGLFVRGLEGLDREAAKRAFATFIAGTTLTANQLEFIDLIVNHLTERGVMSAALLYETPFTFIAPRGPEGLFSAEQLASILKVLQEVRAAAA